MNKIFEPFIRRARTLSRTQILICLALFDNACDQDGYIWATDQEIADKSGTTIPYVRSCMTKMIRERIITRHPHFGNLYRFAYIPLSVQYDRGNHYCKTYKIFYTSNFRTLPVNAMRVLLEALFEVSKNGHHIVTLPESHFHSRNGFSVLSLDRYSRFEQILDAIQQQCSEYLTIRNISKLNPYTRNREKYVQFQFSAEALQADSYKREQLLLENTLRIEGLHDFANNEENLIAILKEQKARFAAAEKIIHANLSKLILRQNEYFMEWSRRVLRHAYNDAVERFVRVLIKNQAEHTDFSSPERVQAYFSSVYQDSLREQLQSITKEYYARHSLFTEMVELPEETVEAGHQNLFSKFSLHLRMNGFRPFTNDEVFQEVGLLGCMQKLLEELLTGWIRSRVGKDSEGKSKLHSRFATKEEAISYVKTLCKREAEAYHALADKFKGFKGHIASTAATVFQHYRDRMLELGNSILVDLDKLYGKTA